MSCRKRVRGKGSRSMAATVLSPLASLAFGGFGSPVGGTAFLGGTSSARRGFSSQKHAQNRVRGAARFPDFPAIKNCRRTGTGASASCSAPDSALAFAPQDNLVSGVAEISFAFSLGVFFSEFAIIQTGCGPMDFSDTLERVCYQGVIVSAGLVLFNRIVAGTSLRDSADGFFGPLEVSTLVQVDVAEYSSALAVLGAFGALGAQYYRGVDMDGLSGIDVAMCRALRDL